MDTSSQLTHAHFAYIAERTRAEDELLVELKKSAAAAGLPSIQVAPEQASFMRILLAAHGARKVVEVGTLGGYSAINIARGLPADGEVHTIELEPARAELARAWIAKSDVAGRITVHCGPGLEVLPTFGDRSMDAAFVDADKVNYSRYLDECLRIVRPGGLILVDNALGFGRILDPEDDTASVSAIRALNDRIKAEPRLDGVIVPLGDGVWVARVLE